MGKEDIITAERDVAVLYASMTGCDPSEVAAIEHEIKVITDRLDALPPGYFEPTIQKGRSVSHPFHRN